VKTDGGLPIARTTTVHLAGADVPDRHICALVHGQDDFYTQLGAFISDGIAAGERGVHVVASRVTHLDRLLELGIDVPERLSSGQLEVLEWSDSYLRGGGFSRPAMLRFLRESLDRGRRLGYARTRYVAMMEWAAEDTPGAADLAVWETEANVMLRARRDVVVCAYDLEHHSASVVTAVREVHSLTLVDGVLRSNRPLSRPAARDRILAAADDYFHNAGIRATGVDTLIEAAGVAKATFYRHFPSKDDLIVAWLRDSRPRWFYRVRPRVEASGKSPADKVPLLYEEAAAWLESEGFRGCAFANAAIEITDSSHPAWPVIHEYLDEIEAYLRDLLTAAGRRDAPDLAQQLAVLLSGAISLGVARRSAAPMLAARNATSRLLADAGRT
jgi:AcrR family transcriptional regulator